MEISKVLGDNLLPGDNILIDDPDGVVEHRLVTIDREDDVVRMFTSEYRSSLYMDVVVIGVMKDQYYYRVVRR